MKGSTKRKMSLREGSYRHINVVREGRLPFIVEDPIDPSYNPAHTVKMGKEYDAIVYEFKRAYLATARKCPAILSIPYN